jgi:hypothetical protein
MARWATLSGSALPRLLQHFRDASKYQSPGQYNKGLATLRTYLAVSNQQRLFRWFESTVHALQ